MTAFPSRENSFLSCIFDVVDGDTTMLFFRMMGGDDVGGASIGGAVGEV